MKKSYAFVTPATNEKAGDVVEVEYNETPQMYVAPVSYFAEQGSQIRTELETERDVLVAQLPKLKGGARTKADHRVRVLEREIRRAIDAEEVTRRNGERVKERQRQQVGADSPFASHTLAEQVASVAALVKRQAKKTLACNASPRCRPEAGKGFYKCARCRAASA